MAPAEQITTESLATWTSAVKAKSAAGRGKSSKLELYGIKKLRELILELAVRGLLVPQDPSDEPASELLNKLSAEKARMVKEGKIRKQKALPPVEEDEKLFQLPAGWEWCRLAETAFSQAGFAFKSKGFNESGIGFPLIRIRDVGQPFSGTFYDGEYRDEFVVTEGDYLISMDGEFRVSPWLGSDALLNQRVSRLIFFSNLLGQRFIAESLQHRLSELQGTKAYTTVDHLSGGQISNSIIALPPAKEQGRIVAKVDELISLCDQLEQQQESSISAHQTLVQTLLDALTTASERDGFTAAWARIADHFDTLFTTEWSIDQLKQTILQLAVMGKLVPQDPNDEPARELLKKIAAKKGQLVKAGEIKKKKSLPPIPEDEMLFELPAGWEWVCLADIAAFENGDRSKRYPNKTDLVDEGIPFFGAPDIRNGKLAYTGELRFISRKKFDELSNGKLRHKDFVVLLRGSVGKVAQFESNNDHFTGFINAQMLIIRLVQTSMDEYVTKYFGTIFFRRHIEKEKSGAVIQQLPASKIEKVAIPVPPMGEQKRIAAKVDELMALCDTLKARINAARATQLHLADAVVEEAVI